jgi:hypothetical protein
MPEVRRALGELRRVVARVAARRRPPAARDAPVGQRADLPGCGGRSRRRCACRSTACDASTCRRHDGVLRRDLGAVGQRDGRFLAGHRARAGWSAATDTMGAPTSGMGRLGQAVEVRLRGDVGHLRDGHGAVAVAVLQLRVDLAGVGLGELHRVRAGRSAPRASVMPRAARSVMSGFGGAAGSSRRALPSPARLRFAAASLPARERPKMAFCPPPCTPPTARPPRPWFSAPSVMSRFGSAS